MRIRTIGIALAALLALGIGGGVLALKAVSAYADADADGFAHAVAGVVRNGFSALGAFDTEGERGIRTASSAAQAGDAVDGDAVDGVAAEAVEAPAFMRKHMMGPGRAEIMMRMRGAMPEGFEEEPGVLVAGVQTDGPAQSGGMIRGDVIVGVDGGAIETLSDLHAAMADRQPGQTVTVDIERGGQPMALEVTLGDLDGAAWLGIAPCGGMHAMPGLGPIHMELHGDGARIMGLEPGGPAESAGVLEGEVITAVDGTEVGPDTDLAEVLTAYSPGDTVTLTLAPSGASAADDEGDGVDAAVEERTVDVTLGEHPDDPERPFLGVHYGIRIIRGPGEDFEFELDPETLGLPQDFDFEELHDLGDGEGGVHHFRFGPDKDGGVFRFFRGPNGGAPGAAPAIPASGGTL